MTIASETIKAQLSRYGSITVEHDGEWLVVKPPSETGFTVSFYDHGDDFIVFYDGWHEHFKDVQRAIKCFVLGLTDAVRVTRYARGSCSCKWICECRTHGDWVPLGTTCRLLVPFWRRRTISVHQNFAVPCDAAERIDIGE